MMSDLAPGIAYDVAIVGAGPVGLAAGISFARRGYRTCVLDRTPEPFLAEPRFDGREIALTHHSVRWLKSVGAWDAIPADEVSPLKTARIESGRSAPPLLFSPLSGAEGDALGHLVPNHLIRRALYRAASGQEGLTLLTGAMIERAHAGRSGADVRLGDGRALSARLLVAADGRFSALREQHGIGAVVHDFNRSILVCRLRQQPAHDAVALQWFDEGQTVALLPVAPDDATRAGEGDRVSLVLTLPKDDVARLTQCPDDVFEAEVSARLQGRAGDVRLLSPRCSYPLVTTFAHRFQAPRFALAGDAAVGMHPITAHGFNLGLRGQETLVRAIADGSGDPGDPSALRRFELAHRRATAPLFAATNLIATAYTQDAAPVLSLRRAGLRVADGLPPFKRFVAGLLMDRAS